MFYKKPGKPEIGELVVCTVRKILPHSVFVSIDEYQNLEGMNHISEISPGRIRNLRDFVTEGRVIVCKVLNINLQGNIDLSLRRVTTNLRINKLKDYKNEEKAEKLVEQIAKNLGMDLKAAYNDLGYKAIEKYGSLNMFFQAISEYDKKAVTDLKVSSKLSEDLYKFVKEKIKPIEVSVKGILNLKSDNSNGLEDIKSILSKAVNKGVNVSYLGAPKYKLEVISKDYKIAEGKLKEFLDEAVILAKKLNCEMNFAKNDKSDS
ncbi:MAG TPA: hypothetical protein VJI68_00260 [Candidatus Nanoarchaeia archaeon]|nr:hypothetical protein [Candidatus Nanoarchaeia archaeon]